MAFRNTIRRILPTMEPHGVPRDASAHIAKRLASVIAAKLHREDDGFLESSLIHDLGRLPVEHLKDPANILIIIENRINMENFPLGYYLHGSSSASLAFVAEEGLKPLGILIKEGKVPFIGEVGPGMIGINQNHISTVDARWSKVSKMYSNTGCRSWSLEISGDNIKRYEERIAELRLMLSNALNNKRDMASNNTISIANDGHKSSLEDLDTHLCAVRKQISIYEHAIDIERKRQERWEALSEYEKWTITEPFSVQYLIDYDGKTTIPISDYKEFAIAAIIPPNRLIAFVPKDKMEDAIRLTKGKLQVHPEEEMGAYIASVVSTNNMYLKAIKEALTVVFHH